ncbi:hypothetical protein [Polyangium aurulentum]|uniref:hypothetical protein n=1 Tax=Polyangium aurulentum TaxID=2567896 RepID=UPI0010AEEA3C|nr:hypothetical protein [Polyangium aurulentum]UQA61105.1 hypothetical protein E8A73_011750 [Polyangium aurulentum]
MTKKIIILACAALASSALGCSDPLPTDIYNNSQCPEGFVQQDEDEGAPMNTEPAQESIDVAACAGGATQAEIDKNLAFVGSIESSLRHLVTCGRFSRAFTYAVSHYFAAIACGAHYQPTAFQYVGTGSYLSGPLTIQTKLLKDTPFGKAGDDIPFDIFDTRNYFESNVIRAALSLDVSWNTNGDYGAHLAGTIEMTPTKPNPDKLALWGIQVGEGEPAKLQQEELAKTIGESVGIVASANVQELVDGVISYRVAIPEFSVSSMYQGQPASIGVVDAAATSEDKTQTASLVDWNIEFIPITAGAAKGSITLRIEGGKFPYYVRYTFPNRSDPDVLVSCTAPAP